ncbi:hypothetical protein [Amycolatopsis australiensis]|uniref:PPE family protein n=1 Tax=Amycolatopsis australiensis TaxID=546364 RepID=A0A1K1SWA1_9PSEU|nr:hypothetical protein [Amycolatopsis australiensis]SFW88610.1 hypothetical protein SAMN04489730_7016 [Amycolatopsis australiensis]
MFPFDQLGVAAHGVVRGAHEAGSALVRTAQDAVEWAGDLFSGKAAVQAMTVPTVVERVLAGNSSSWTANGVEAGKVAAEHYAIAGELTAMLNSLEPTWTGRGAEQAKQRTKAFSDLVERAAKTLGSNGTNVADAAYGFELAKRSMEPMGPRPERSFFDAATPWDTDTEDAISVYNAKAQKNLEIYSAYVEHLDSQGQRLSGDYGQVTLGTSADPVTVKAVDSRSIADARRERSIEPPGDTDDTPVVDRQSMVRVDPGRVTEPREHDPYAPAATTGVVAQPGYTRTTGLTPPSGVQDARAFSGLPPLSQLERAAGSSVSDSSGARSPLIGFPCSPLSSAPNAALRRGVVDEVGNEPRRAGVGPRFSGSGRASGRPGPELAGVGPAGGGHPSAEDEEHERKYVRDDDSVFADVEEGLVDPRTGLAPVPPTLGT